jgi:thioredoxin reductase
LLAVHLQRWEIEVRLEAVHQVEDAGGKGWRVVSDTGSAEYGHVLIATGTRPRQVDLPWSGERDQARIHRGPLVLHELEPCRVVIIGGGDAAFDYALGLGERHEVAIHHRAARPVALPLLVERVQRAGISVRQASRLSEIAATAQDLVLSFETGGVREQVRTKHLLLAIGREPELELLGPRRKEGEAGRLEREGLRLIGDVGNGIERQASISAGQGVRAAMALARRLETEQR